MHIPYGVLESRVALATTVLGAAALGYGLRSVRKEMGERATPAMGMTAAFIFAAQMVNFPVGVGVSGHLLGGVLAAVILGPWAGAVAIGAVLLVQCFLFGDGALEALGANFLNMGILGSVCGYAIYAPIRRAVGGRRGILIGSMVAAWFSVLLAAGACAVELTIGHPPRDFLRILSWMALVHSFIGLGEAAITGMVVRLVLLARPELIWGEGTSHLVKTEANPDLASPRKGPSWGSTAFGGLAAALAVAVFLSPLASEFPDGLEFVGEKLGLLSTSAEPLWPTPPVPMPDYSLAFPGSDHLNMATAVAGFIGTLVVFFMSWSLARVFAVRDGSSERLGADVA